MIVTSEDHLLQRAHVVLQYSQPVALQPDLVHVDVPRRDRLVSALKAFVLHGNVSHFNMTYGVIFFSES